MSIQVGLESVKRRDGRNRDAVQPVDACAAGRPGVGVVGWGRVSAHLHLDGPACGFLSPTRLRREWVPVRALALANIPVF